MSNFFMWGGFVFCTLWHIGYLAVFYHNFTSGDETSREIQALHVGISGISLCYFGMQAFG